MLIIKQRVHARSSDLVCRSVGSVESRYVLDSEYLASWLSLKIKLASLFTVFVSFKTKQKKKSMRKRQTQKIINRIGLVHAFLLPVTYYESMNLPHGLVILRDISIRNS